MRQCFKILGSLLIAFLMVESGTAFAGHLSCPDPKRPEQLSWCADPSSDHFTKGVCVAEPIGKNRAIANDPSETIDVDEVTSDAVCLLGKIDSAEVQNVVDFTANAEFLPGNQFEALLDLDVSLFAPELDILLEQGEFQSLLPIPRAGAYNVSLQARFIRNGILEDVKSIKRILRLSAPHVSVEDARPGGGGTSFGVTEQPPQDPTQSSDHTVGLTPPAEGFGVKSIDFCLASTHATDADHPSYPGENLIFTATNSITEGSGSHAKRVTISCKTGDGICNAVPGGTDFCSSGMILNVPVGHGTNEIEIVANNEVTGSDPMNGENIRLDPIQNDLKGPKLCVSYLNEAGNSIADADGRVVLPSEAKRITVDLTLGNCLSKPEEVKIVSCASNEEADCSDDWPVCIRRNEDSDKFIQMCPRAIGGTTHYQATLPNLRFPVNSFTIKAVDKVGNQALETHSFNYGSIRPMFDQDGKFNLQNAMVPTGVGGFLPEPFLTGEMKELVLKVLNSEKFRNDIFPKLLDPHQPIQEEIACMKSLEKSLPCTYDHLASRERVVAIKAFCDNGQCDGVGNFEIPSFYLLNDKTIWLQVKLKGLHGRAEMYTIAFRDSDNDGVVDTEDDDADDDGICDRDQEVRGVCERDESVSAEDCPDFKRGDDLEDYKGCSDQDDDGDDVTDSEDLPGRLVPDPDFGIKVIPLRFAVKELVLNLQIHLEKDTDGRIRVEVTNVPERSLIEAVPDDRDLLELDCDKMISEIRQGGTSEEEGNGQLLRLSNDYYACQAFNNLNENLPAIRQLPGGEWAAEELLGIDFKKRKFQGINDQFLCTMDAIARCSIPQRVESTLADFDDEKVTAIDAKVLEKRFHFDFYAPLGSSDLYTDRSGLGFTGKGVLLPAGVTDADDKAERDSIDFLETLPEEFRSDRFGPVFEEEVDEGDRIDPMEAAYGMASEIGLALKEETVNSLLQAININLFDQDRQEPDDLKTMDLFAKRLRETFEGGIGDVGGNICRDKDNQVLDVDKNWKCFPFALSLDNLLGPTTINYIDFDKNGVVEPATDSQVPVLIRTTLNSLSAPSVKLVNASAIEGFAGGGALRPRTILAELAIGLPPTTMAIYEEESTSANLADPETGETTSVRRGTGVIKSWCDADRFTGMDPESCPAGKRSPIVVFEATGRIFVTLLLDRGDNGILRVAAGVSSHDGPNGAELDTEKSYLRVQVLKNNTIVPDQVLANNYEGNLMIMLGKYTFGTQRTIAIKVPTMVPLEDFCKKFPGEIQEVCDCVKDPSGPDCDSISAIQDLWDDLDLDRQFGFEGFELQDPLLSIGGSSAYSEDPTEAAESNMGSPRYMTLGLGVCVKDRDGHCIGEAREE